MNLRFAEILIAGLIALGGPIAAAEVKGAETSKMTSSPQVTSLDCSDAEDEW